MKRFKTVCLVSAVALLVALVVAGPAVAAKKYKGFERGDALISVQELKKMMDANDPKLVVIGVMKPISFKAGHIPDSLNVWRPDYEPEEDWEEPFEEEEWDEEELEGDWEDDELVDEDWEEDEP